MLSHRLRVLRRCIVESSTSASPSYSVIELQTNVPLPVLVMVIVSVCSRYGYVVRLMLSEVMIRGELSAMLIAVSP